MASIGEKIEHEVIGWEGVEARPHRYGGVEFRVRGHEIGHLHGDRLADLPFPLRVRKELVAEGRALPLFRLNYERLTARGRSETVVEGS